MKPIDMAGVMRSLHDLPSLPVVVLELLGRLDQDDADIKMLADRVARDQALTAKTLRLANSSFYGMQRKVATLQQAITVLGFDAVRTLVTAAAIIDTFPAGAAGRFDFPSFWREAIGTALCAKALARQLQLNQEQAFLAGLLHDIGRLVLAVHVPDRYEQVLAHRDAVDCSLLEAERSVLGIDHTVAGRSLAEHWKFPSVILKAIEFHHQPDRSEAQAMSALVQAADAVAHALDLSASDTPVPLLATDLWHSLRLDDGLLREAYAEVDEQYEEACQVLAR